MKAIPFFAWASPVSVLGYGTTSFMSADTTKGRLALLECALDFGITHFDTATYYGYGEAERLLGEALQGKRDKVTITTKFGLEAGGLVKARWVNLAARRLLALVPGLKRVAAKARGAVSTAGQFDPVKAAASLDRSLQSLRTDYVDLFLLHEPELADASSGPLIEFLDGEVARGRIRAYGCGGEWHRIHGIAGAGLATGRWLQFEDNAVARHIEQASGFGAKCITFAPFNSALKTLVDWLGERPGAQKAWGEELGVDCGDKEVLAGLLQASCHARNADGIVLFSSKSPARIKQSARIASGEMFTTEQVTRFLELTKETLTETRRH
jgi:aryl-alcohol dehydrogenase-like predicted oxidoreductase